MWSLASLALRGLVDLIAPPTCAGCDGGCDAEGPTAGAEHDGFCAACAPLLERAALGVRSGAAYVWGGPLADSIRRFKYAGRSELSAPLGALFAAAALELAGRYDVVVPVPLHPARLRQRGFDQAALLALPVARALGIPRAVGGLGRVRVTAVQASLARPQRIDNVRGAFRVAPVLVGARVLLIDDVRTTGATLSEASSALLRAGVRAVHPVALAAVAPGEDID